ncbi:hypothetical protein [Pseudoalteromonas sp. KS88]|uniref:hypothetical protein n=1 Tax=Pseudoalteromonas sp. KS88 TaxID=2109918 RepID=UPI001FD8C2AD|nr:hypothetical protein [Pseudoalteromonas sp. KS88]
MKYIFLIITIILSVGCSSLANAHDPEKMADLASQLKDISAAIDGTLKFSSEPYTDPHKLLLAAIKDDKSKLEPFENYQLRIVIQEKTRFYCCVRKKYYLSRMLGVPQNQIYNIGNLIKIKFVK